MSHLRLIPAGQGPAFGPPPQISNRERWRMHLALILSESRRPERHVSDAVRPVAPDDAPGGAAA